LTATVVAAAGAVASVAAFYSLAQLRYSERLHSEVVAEDAEAERIGDPRRHALEQETRATNLPWRPAPQAYYFWQVALIGFVIADVLALVCTRVD
jgi:hypothetical protein